jgi:hypothetical protein
MHLKLSSFISSEGSRALLSLDYSFSFILLLIRSCPREPYASPSLLSSFPVYLSFQSPVYFAHFQPRRYLEHSPLIMASSHSLLQRKARPSLPQLRLEAP